MSLFLVEMVGVRAPVAADCSASIRCSRLCVPWGRWTWPRFSYFAACCRGALDSRNETREGSIGIFRRRPLYFSKAGRFCRSGFFFTQAAASRPGIHRAPMAMPGLFCAEQGAWRSRTCCGEPGHRPGSDGYVVACPARPPPAVHSALWAAADKEERRIRGAWPVAAAHHTGKRPLSLRPSGNRCR